MASLHDFSVRTQVHLILLALALGARTGFGAPETTLPEAAAATNSRIAERRIAVQLSVPDAAWTLAIREIWRVRGELWVFVGVERPDGAVGAMMICTARDEVTVRLPDLPTRVFVEGKTWGWKNTEPIEWVSRDAPVFEKRREGERVWVRSCGP